MPPLQSRPWPLHSLAGSTARAERRAWNRLARAARGLSAVVAGFCAAVIPAAAISATVDTPALTFTGIGDTIAPPGATMKGLPPSVTTTAITFTGIGDTIAPPGTTKQTLPPTVATTAITFTGIGDTIAPPGATKKPLPAQLNTESIVMTGVGG